MQLRKTNTILRRQCCLHVRWRRILNHVMNLGP